MISILLLFNIKTTKHPAVIFCNNLAGWKLVYDDPSTSLCFFSRKLPSKEANLKTFRITQSPLQEQKQIYFLNKANEDKHLTFVLLFLFHSCFCLCPFFFTHKLSSICTDTAHLSDLYLLQRNGDIYIGQGTFPIILIHLSQHCHLWEAPPTLIHLSISHS